MVSDVLAGPILRRVETRSVSVLLALRHPARIILAVYPIAGSWNGDGRVAPADRPTSVLVGERKTLAIGQSVHVAVVTATNGLGLAPDTLYYYDVQVTREDTGVTTTLDGFGLLDDRVPAGLALGYKSGRLPVVVLPPSQLSELRLFHGSCRKPHAPGVDALAVLDERIKAHYTDPRARPHQLVLTGDQIYADDVATCVAVPLREQAKLLMWGEDPQAPVESLVLQVGDPSVPFTDVKFGPRERQRYVRRPFWLPTPTGFSSKEAENHLFAFAEFVAMYLLAWSESAWPERVFARQPPAPDPPEMLGVEPNEGLRKEAEAVAMYLETLPRVRRVLANVACYMQCDDHEVTDDWNLDRTWSKRVHESPSGTRVLTNGLAAYAMFQWWGTDPAQFAQGSGAELLDLLENWRGTDDARRATIATRLGIAPPDTPVPDTERIDLHSRTEFPTHVLVMLDTRTRRGPRPPTPTSDRMRLIDQRGLDQQLPAPSVSDGRLLVVVSPTPVLGLRTVEGIQEILGHTEWGREENDVETWSNHPAGLYSLLDRLAEHRSVVVLSGDVHYGFTIACDYWRAATGPATIVQLTSSALKNQSNQPVLPLPNGIKSLLGGTMFLHGLALRIEDFIHGRQNAYALWTGAPARYRYRVVDNDGRPVGLPRPPWMTRPDRAVGVGVNLMRLEASRAPDAIFRITPALADTVPTPAQIKDLIADRTASAPAQWDDPVATAQFQAQIAEAHSEVLSVNGPVGRWLVGYNNLGEVRFSEGPSMVSHTLWWAVPYRDGKPVDLERAAPLTTSRHRLYPPPDAERPIVEELSSP